jgi:hypothetical protein
MWGRHGTLENDISLEKNLVASLISYLPPVIGPPVS